MLHDSLPVEPVPCRTMRLGVSRRFTAAVVLLATLTFLPALTGVVSALAGHVGALLLVVPMAMVLGTSFFVRRRANLGPGRARVESGQLHLEGESRTTTLPLDRISWGARADRVKGVDLELIDGRRVHLVPEHAGAVDALLFGSGASVDQRAMLLPLRGTIGPFVRALLLCLLYVMPLSFLLAGTASKLGAALGTELVTIGVLAAWPLSIYLAAWTARASTPRLLIGLDGLRIKLGFRERFIPHEEVRSVEVEQRTEATPQVVGTHLRVTTARAGVLHLPVIDWTEDDVQRALTRIEEAAELRRARNAGARGEAFARRGMPVESWRAELRRRLSGVGDHRTSRLTVEDAERVLADAAAPLEQRVGAALALRALDTAGHPERIRIAASASADPATARSLLAAAAKEDAALEELLEAEERARSRPRRAVP